MPPTNCRCRTRASAFDVPIQATQQGVTGWVWGTDVGTCGGRGDRCHSLSDWPFGVGPKSGWHYSLQQAGPRVMQSWSCGRFVWDSNGRFLLRRIGRKDACLDDQAHGARQLLGGRQKKTDIKSLPVRLCELRDVERELKTRPFRPHASTDPAR